MSGDARHSRSILFPGIGEEGQARIARFSIAFVGAGAVGAAAAETAVRAGFARLTIVDRDVVEPSNLARQFLYDAEDAARIAPKAEAAAARLSEIDPSVPVRPVVADLDASQRPGRPCRPRPGLRRLGQLRDAASRVGRGARPGPAFGVRGLRRGRGACRGFGARPDALPALLSRGASAAGLGPDVRHGRRRPDVAAARRVPRDDGGPSPRLREGGVLRNAASSRRGTAVSPRGGMFESARPSPACPVCARGRFPALEGEGASELVKLCGRQSVQVTPAARSRPDFDAARAPALAARPRAALATAPERGRRGRQPDGLSRRALRRARDRRPAAGALALRPLHRKLSVRRIAARGPPRVAGGDRPPSAARLARGGVAAIPTETFYGLAGDPHEPRGRRAHPRDQAPRRDEGRCWCSFRSAAQLEALGVAAPPADARRDSSGSGRRR